MECKLDKGKYLLVSDGTPKENAAINAIIKLMWHTQDLPDEAMNDFGNIQNGDVVKNFVYLPEYEIIET